MERRGFLQTLIGGIGAAAAVRTFPFRVYSFPSEIKLLSKEEITDLYLKPAVQSLFDDTDRTLSRMFETTTKIGNLYQVSLVASSQGTPSQKVLCATRSLRYFL